jgi:tight adherence protein B
VSGPAGPVLVVLSAIVATVVVGPPVGRRRRAAAVRNRLVARSPDRIGNPPVGRDGGWAPWWFIRRLDALAVEADPVTVWRVTCVITAATAGLAVVLGGPALAGVVLTASAGIVALVVDTNRDRADRQVDAALPALLDRVAAGLRAGLGLSVALVDSVPPEPGALRRDLVALTLALDAGMPLPRALDRWRRQRATPGTLLVTAALALCAVAGGRSRPLDGVASTLRDRLAIEREVRAVSAQMRASALVLVATPWVFVLFTVVQDPDVLGFYLGTAPGLGCLVGGLVLDLGGAWLMARTVRGVR